MKFWPFLRTVFAALILMLGLVPAMAEEIIVDHAQGRTELTRKPAKVFTFDLAALDTLDALGIEVSGVPASNIPDYLGKYRDGKYLKIGTLFQPDYEAVHAAHPDLIIVGDRSAPAYPQLAEIAPTIDLTLQPARFMASVQQNTTTLGRIFGKEAEASALTARLEQSAAKVRELAKKAGKALIIMTNGGKITAYGKGSRFGWLHDDLGVEPAVAGLDAGTHGEAVSFEFLLQANPDWLFVLDRDSVVGNAGESARRTLDNELVAVTTAAQKDQIVYVDAERWYLVGGGVGALQSSIDQLATILNR